MMKKHVILLCLLLMVLIVPAFLLNLQTGLYVGEDFLIRTETGYGPLTLQTQADAVHVTGSIDGFSWEATVQTSDAGMSVTLADGTTTTGTWDGEHLCDQRGVPYAYLSGNVTVVVGNETLPPNPIFQSDVLCRMALGQTEQRGSLYCILMGMVCYIIGAMAILFPDFAYFFGRRWLFASAELSDTGRTFQRFGGIVGLIGAVFLMYLPMFT